MYSGGLDSLGTLYYLLTDPVYKDYKIHVHHIHHNNVENRARAEAFTVNAALAELKRLGFTFDFSESSIGTQPFGNKFMRDTDSINFFAGYICSVNPDIELVALGMQANDANQSLENRRKRADAILAAFTSVKKIYPVMDKTKREIYDSLPAPLKDMFWSCRRPVYSETSARPCGLCDTCLELRKQAIR